MKLIPYDPHTRKERKKFPFLLFTLMLISRLFQAGSRTCFLILTLVLVLIAQVGTGLKLSQIMSQMRCRIFYQTIRSDRVCSEIYCLQTACTFDLGIRTSQHFPVDLHL